MKSFLKVLCGAACAVALSASALAIPTVNMSTVGVGWFAINPSTVDTNKLNNLITVYNGGGPIAGYTAVPGSSTPATIPVANGVLAEVNASGTPITIDLGAGGYTYLIVQWNGWNSGGGQAVYYIAGLTGQISVANDFFFNDNHQPYGASGYWLGTSRTTVPDGGATVGLLGLGLLGLAIIRRKFMHA